MLFIFYKILKFRYLWQLKIGINLHWCLMGAVPLYQEYPTFKVLIAYHYKRPFFILNVYLFYILKVKYLWHLKIATMLHRCLIFAVSLIFQVLIVSHCKRPLFLLVTKVLQVKEPSFEISNFFLCHSVLWREWKKNTQLKKQFWAKKNKNS